MDQRYSLSFKMFPALGNEFAAAFDIFGLVMLVALSVHLSGPPRVCRV